MMDCPFLSTYENDVECFKECPLYEWKGNNGVCPFKVLKECRIEKVDVFSETDCTDNEIKYVRNFYEETKNEVV